MASSNGDVALPQDINDMFPDPTIRHIFYATLSGDCEYLKAKHAEGVDILSCVVPDEKNPDRGVETLMHIAVRTGQHDIIKFLHTIDPTLVNSTACDQCPLEVAIICGDGHDHRTFDVLIDLGAVPMLRPGKDDRLFGVIALKNDIHALRKLAEGRTDRLNAVNDGCQPFDIAIAAGHANMALEMRKYGALSMQFGPVISEGEEIIGIESTLRILASIGEQQESEAREKRLREGAHLCDDCIRKEKNRRTE